MTDLLTYEDLSARWGICKRQVLRVCRRMGIEPVDMGHRTKRFRPDDVLRGEERLAGSKRSRNNLSRKQR